MTKISPLNARLPVGVTPPARDMTTMVLQGTMLHDGIPPGLRFAEAAAMSLFIGMCAQLEVPLAFTPVPITGQGFAVLLAGVLLGSRRGALAVVLYLAEGAAGMPVFAGGAGGAAHFLGPTGGYLLGFLPAAWLAGRLAERGWDGNALTAALTMAAGSAVLFLCGLSWLSLFVPAGQLLVAGLWPFLPGDAVKIALAALILPQARRWVGR